MACQAAVGVDPSLTKEGWFKPAALAVAAGGGGVMPSAPAKAQAAAAAAGSLALVLAFLEGGDLGTVGGGTTGPGTSSSSRGGGVVGGDATEYEMRVVEGVYVSMSHGLNFLLETCPHVSAAELGSSGGGSAVMWPSKPTLSALQAS